MSKLLSKKYCNLTGRINVETLTAHCQAYALNDSALFEELQSDRKPNEVAWKICRDTMNRFLKFKGADSITASALKDWLAEHGRGYGTLQPLEKWVIEERREFFSNGNTCC